MAGLWDAGRPTGGLAGIKYAKEDYLKDKEQRINVSDKQAKFFEYMDNAELRAEQRATDIMTAQHIRERMPSKTDEAISQSELASEQAESDKRLVEPLYEEEVRRIHNNMTRQQLDRVGTAYNVISKGIRADQDPKQLYDDSRRIFVTSDADPEAASAWLDQHGVTEEFTEASFAAYSTLASTGARDIATTRAELINDEDAANRLLIERAKAAASTKPAKDGSYPAATKEDKKGLGYYFKSTVEKFDDLEGKLDDDTDSWNGAKGQFVELVSRVSREVVPQLRQGNIETTPQHIEEVAADLLDTHYERYTVDKMEFGPYGGDEFLGQRFENDLHAVVNSVRAARAHIAAPVNSDFMDTYRGIDPRTGIAYSVGIMEALSLSHQKEDARLSTLEQRQSGSTEPTPAPVDNTPATVTAPAPQTIPSPSIDTTATTQSSKPEVPETVKDLTLQINKLTQQMESLASAGKKYVKGSSPRMKSLSPEYKELLAKKQALSAQKQKLNRKYQETLYQKGMLK